jgi:large subunit ribosomal protein L10
LKREDKEQTVADLHRELEEAQVAILTRFTGLNVEKMTQLRRELAKEAVNYRVVKNTLLRLAIQGTDKEVLKDKINGPLAVAWSQKDPVSPTRVLARFAKDSPELQIMGASSEGRLFGPAQIQEWVNLPSLEGLRGRILGLIQTPGVRLVRLLKAPGTQIARVLQIRGKEA